jgi:hypothetical protein
MHFDAGPVAEFGVAEGDAVVVVVVAAAVAAAVAVAAAAVVAQEVLADVVGLGVVVEAGVADVRDDGSCSSNLEVAAAWGVQHPHVCAAAAPLRSTASPGEGPDTRCSWSGDVVGLLRVCGAGMGVCVQWGEVRGRLYAARFVIR